MASHSQQSDQVKKSTQKRPPAPLARQQPTVEAQQQTDPAAAQRAALDVDRAKPADILSLQRSVGNETVARLISRRLARRSIQAKLTVSSAGDQHEQEADRVADQVVSAPEERGVQRQPVAQPSGTGVKVQRWAEEEHKTFGDLAAQLAMKYDWTFPVGGQTVTPAGVGAAPDHVPEGKDYKKFTEGKVDPLKKELTKKMGKGRFSQSGVGVGFQPTVIVGYTPDGMPITQRERGTMSFGDATMLGGDYFKTAGDLAKAETVNPLGPGMESRMVVVAATNTNHFFPLAGKEWGAQYAAAKALAAEARKAYLRGDRVAGDANMSKALQYLGVAIHFLQDTFASGHQYPRALDDIDSRTTLGTAYEGLANAKTYHDALCKLKDGLPMLYGQRFHGDYTATGSDFPVVEESYRALAHLLSIVSGKPVPGDASKAPRPNPGPDVAKIMQDKVAMPIWGAMVNHIEKGKLKSAKDKPDKELTTSANTPYKAKEITDKWDSLAKTTTIAKLEGAVREDSDNAIRDIIKKEGVPQLGADLTARLVQTLVTGICGSEDEQAVLRILGAQSDATMLAAIKTVTPEKIDRGLDGKAWDDFLVLWASRGQAGNNPGIEYIVKERNRAAIKKLVAQLQSGQMSRVSKEVWRIIKSILSDNWFYTSADEKAAIKVIDLYIGK